MNIDNSSFKKEERPATASLKFVTSDKELVNDPDYQKILKIVKDLWESGVISRGAGYCFSMSDLLRVILLQNGISSKLTECKVTIMGNNPPTMALVGHDGTMPRMNPFNPDNIDTHVIVVTETKVPMIIDLSIKHIRSDIPYVIERANGEDDIIADINFGTSRWTYQRKLSVSVPAIHQQNILERIKTDKEIRREMSWLKIIVFSLLIISSLNALRGAYDFHERYIDDSNLIGESANKLILKRITELEEKTKDIDKLQK